MTRLSVRSVQQPMLLVLFVTLLSWPVVANRSAVLYPDTGRYLMNGLNLWSAVDRLAGRPKPAPLPRAAPTGDPAAPAEPKTILGGRSPYYGAFAWGARSLGGLGGIALGQAVWLALVLAAALPRFGITGAVPQVAATAVLATLSPLAFFVAVVMPDVFAGIALIGVILLWFQWRTMSPLERFGWSVNIGVAALFHASFIAMSLALLACLAVAGWRRWQQGMRPFMTVVAALAVGAAATAAMDFAIRRATGRTIMPIPFLLARTIGDGTAARVLQTDCATTPYATCRIVPSLPLTENQFLWGRPGVRGWNLMPPRLQLQIAREQSPIVARALERYPLRQIGASAGNFARMLVTADLAEFGYSRELYDMFRNPLFAREQADARSSRIYQQKLTLAPFSAFWLTTYCAALVVAGVGLLFRRRLRIDPASAALATALIGAVVISAAVCGILGGVWGRYTARVAWLAVLAAIIISQAAWRGREQPGEQH